MSVPAGCLMHYRNWSTMPAAVPNLICARYRMMSPVCHRWKSGAMKARNVTCLLSRIRICRPLSSCVSASVVSTRCWVRLQKNVGCASMTLISAIHRLICRSKYCSASHRKCTAMSPIRKSRSRNSSATVSIHLLRFIACCVCLRWPTRPF